MCTPGTKQSNKGANGVIGANVFTHSDNPAHGDNAMSIGTILLIILVIILLGGFSGLGAARSTAPAITVAAGSAS